MSEERNVTNKQPDRKEKENIQDLEEELEGLAKQVARNINAIKIIAGDLHDLREDVDFLLDKIFRW